MLAIQVFEGDGVDRSTHRHAVTNLLLFGLHWRRHLQIVRSRIKGIDREYAVLISDCLRAEHWQIEDAAWDLSAYYQPRRKDIKSKLGGPVIRSKHHQFHNQLLIRLMHLRDGPSSG